MTDTEKYIEIRHLMEIALRDNSHSGEEILQGIIEKRIAKIISDTKKACKKEGKSYIEGCMLIVPDEHEQEIAVLDDYLDKAEVTG